MHVTQRVISGAADEMLALPAPALEIRLMGTFQVRLHGVPFTAFRVNRMKGLLAYLASGLELPFHRGRLLDLFWPDQASTEDMRQTLSRLRRLLEQVGLEHQLSCTRHTISLASGPGLLVDAQLLRAALMRWHEHCKLEGTLCQICALALQQASTLYQGDFCLDVPVSYSEDLTRWCLSARSSLRGDMLQGLQALAAWQLRQGRPLEAERWLYRLLELEPFHEEGVRRLLTLLTLRGAGVEASTFFEGWQHRLRRSLGTQPETATRLLMDRLQGEKGKPVVAVAAQLPQSMGKTPAERGLAHFSPPLSPRDSTLAGHFEACLGLLQTSSCRMLTLLETQTEPASITASRLKTFLERQFPGAIRTLSLGALDSPRTYRERLEALMADLYPPSWEGVARDEAMVLLIQEGAEASRIDRASLLRALSSHPGLKVVSLAPQPLHCRIEHRLWLQDREGSCSQVDEQRGAI